MQAEVKMARVYSGRPNVVNLDCSKYSLTDWKNIFDSNNPADAVFILHESLRIGGKEKEDDYNASSSYLAAIRQVEVDKRSIVSTILGGTDKVCRLGWETRCLDAGFGIHYMAAPTFYLNNQVVSQLSEVQYGFVSHDGNNIQGTSNPPAVSTAFSEDQIYQLAVKNNCESIQNLHKRN